VAGLAVDALIALEEAGEVFGCDADSVVLHRDPDLAVPMRGRDEDLAAVGRVLHCVAQQVRDDLEFRHFRNGTVNREVM